MPHVQLRTGRACTNGGAAQLIVDDVDITMAVLADGFSLDIGEPGLTPATITMSIQVDDLDLDLPDAVINSLAVTKDGE